MKITEIEKGCCGGGWTPVYANWKDGMIVATSKYLPNEIQIWRFSYPDLAKENWSRGQHWFLDYCGSDKAFWATGRAAKAMSMQISDFKREEK